MVCNVRLVDTVLLSPTGSRLADLGRDLGISKVELPEGYSKDRMDRFLEDHPDEFARYALTDAEIAARWVTRIRGVLLTEFGIRRPVPTLGAASVELVRKHFKQLGQDLNAFLGQEKARKPFLEPGSSPCDGRAGLSRRIQPGARARLLARGSATVGCGPGQRLHHRACLYPSARLEEHPADLLVLMSWPLLRTP